MAELNRSFKYVGNYGLALIVSVALCPSPARAQGAGSHAGPVDGRPSHAVIFPGAPENQQLDPRSDSGWHVLANSYGAALAFTECVSKLDPSSLAKIVERPIGQDGEWGAMKRLARKYRTCVRDVGPVAPILIRVAIAETAMKRAAESLARRDTDPRSPLGVPDVVAGYPLGRVARCHVGNAPNTVRALLQTRPGSAAERNLATLLFRGAPQCGTKHGLGRLHPTAARLALIEAANQAR